ncbi:DEKNAAC103634 [Brettanomyces naardenensis]|uniref:DEKNAAC103634 n=1 Tax=Brettanomyces naardenensis TaxID=13370 RepID=A0A448YN78_BRENA|nr:DEKNAAC103634 [Brettanomyces naardenensis]
MSETITIDREDTKNVEQYIRKAFREMMKKKTRLLLVAYYDWFVKDPLREAKGPPMIEMDESLQRRKMKLKHGVLLFNEAYISLLIPFIRKFSLYSNELIDVASKLKDLNTKVDGHFAFGLLFSERDMRLLKGIFRLISKKEGKVNVLKPTERKKVAAVKKITDSVDVKAASLRVPESVISDLENKLNGLAISVKIMRGN